MIKLKLCGMRRPEDISYINQYPPHYAGFILSPGFRRSIDRDTFLSLVSQLDKSIGRVGVFVDEPPENILQYTEYLDVIQLHGSENAEYIAKLRPKCGCEIWKAVRAKCTADIESADKLECDKLLIDSFSAKSVGGTGETADLQIILNADFSKPYYIAGGVSAANIKDILDTLKDKPPVGADLSSSIETDGCKDINKIREIYNIVKKECLQ
ncbi:MAG: phosphoribosylanthranilate isomerase [Oscillospiraceae bacterium]